jgi:hypothetical protein
VKIAIVGSRNYDALEFVDTFVRELPAGAVVVSGGARGVDQRSELQARLNRLEVESLRPDWSKGKGAALDRNSGIVNAADLVVAFWDGDSRGTADTIAKARRSGKLLGVVGPKGAHFSAVMRDLWRRLGRDGTP